MTTKCAYTRRVRTAPLITAEELLEMSIPDKQVELVRGRLFVREPPGPRHGGVAVNLMYEMESYVRAHGGGRVFADVGFKIFTSPDTVRAPDVAFIKAGRAFDPRQEKYFNFAPDIAIEVISPRDRAGKVREKVADWLKAGSALVWVIYPRLAIARVYRADGTVTLVDADGVLDGEDVFRGFSCPLLRIL
jgi:Uma2 family endonuclease